MPKICLEIRVWGAADMCRTLGTVTRRHTYAASFLVTLCLFTMVWWVAPHAFQKFVAGFVYSRSPAVAYYLNRSDAALALQLGQYYFGGGAYNLRKAATSYELALQLDPTRQLARYQLARIYFVDGQFDRALAHINTELRMFPYNPRSLYVRGLIYISLDNLSAAEQDFRNFVAWAPFEWGGYNDLAFVLAKEGKYAESETVVMEAMQKISNAKDIPWLCYPHLPEIGTGGGLQLDQL